ncbi:MAG: hypothetical protein V3W41_15690 [Planctomycetota bacterium]
MRRVSLLLLVALATSALVHHRAIKQELAGADRGRAIGLYPDLGHDGPGAVPEMDLSPLLYQLEQLAFGASHASYMLWGLLLLAFAGATLGLAARRLARRCDPGDRQIPLDIGLMTAALFPASALMADCVVSLPGHVILVACSTYALSTIIACRRPTPITLGFVPLVLSLLFAETGGLAFLTIPIVVLGARPDALGQASRQRGLAILAAALLLARLSELVLCTPLSGARDVGEVSLGFIESLWRNASALAVPVSSETGLGERALLAHRISFAGTLLALVVWGHFCGRPGQRRVALAAFATMVICLLIAGRSLGISSTYGDIRTLAFANIGLCLFLALGIDAAAKRGNRELIALGLLVFLIYSHLNAAQELRQSRDSEVFPEEYRLVVENLNKVPEDIDGLLLLGVDAKFPRAQWAKALPAEARRPWFSRDLVLRARAEGHVNRLDAALFADKGKTLICEWRPQVMWAASTRPKGWIISPLVASPSSGIETQRLRLVSPAPEAELELRVPGTIEEDMTFVFETAPDFELRENSVFVFYGIYEGGRNPRGRSQLTARPLVPRVLKKSEGQDGWVRWSWRTSIRPEEGHDGVRFEDRDLELAGKPFYWTVGVAPLAPTPNSGKIAPGHVNHAHDASMSSRVYPVSVAQTRRIYFENRSKRVDG